MKSNITDLFTELIGKYKGQLTFSLKDFADEVEERFEFVQDEEQEDLLAYLKRFYIETRLRNMLNLSECYSWSKNEYVSLDKAGMKALVQMDENFARAIQGRKDTLDRIRKREEEFIGQMELIFYKNEIVGTEERKSLAELFGEMRDNAEKIQRNIDKDKDHTRSLQESGDKK